MEKTIPSTETLINKFHVELNRINLQLPDSSNEWQNIKKLFLQIADALRTDISGSQIPINLKPYFKYRRIHQVIDITKIDGLGHLLPDLHGFKIYVNKMGRKRTRATLAHEIGHTFFYDISKSPPKRYFRALDLYKKKGKIWEKEEWLCWDFAHELLVPSKIFNSLIEDSNFDLTPESIIELSRKFDVSMDFIFRKGIVNLRKWKEYCFFTTSSSLDERKFPVNKGEKFPKNITLYGVNGLITSNSKMRKAILKQTDDEDNFTHEVVIEKNGKIINIQFCKYSQTPSRILGVCKITNPNLGQQTLI